MAAQANLGAKWQTSTAILATEKMEQLRGLTWGFDNTGLGLPLSDTTTDLCYDPPTNNGLGPQPVAARHPAEQHARLRGLSRSVRPLGRHGRHAAGERGLHPALVD